MARDGPGHTYASAQRPVLQDLNLSVQAGEHIAVVGRSGCGKSTLLSLIAGGNASPPGARAPPAGALTHTLADEPLGALDALTRAGVPQWLRETITSTSATLDMRTHDVGPRLTAAPPQPTTTFPGLAGRTTRLSPSFESILRQFGEASRKRASSGSAASARNWSRVESPIWISAMSV